MNALEILRNIFFKDISIGTLNLPFSLIDVLFKVLLPILVVMLVYKLVLLGIRQLLRLLKIQPETADRISLWSRRVLRVASFFAVIAFIGSLLGTEIAKYMGQFITLVNQPFFETGNTKISLITLIMLIPVFWAASWGGKYTRHLVDRSFIKNLKIDEARKFSIGTMSRYAVMAIILLFGLSVIGIDLSALGVLFGVLGIGLGFGLQGTVANFFAGLFIITTGNVKEQDRILVNGFEGTVVHIKMLSTIVSTITHENLIIPNSHLMENTVHNYSFDDRRIVLINEVSVSYNADLDKVIRIMEEVARANKYSLHNPEPVARVASFGDSGINMKVISWIDDINHKHEFLGDINLELWRAFKREGIEIPFPQLDLHVKKTDAKDEMD